MFKKKGIALAVVLISTAIIAILGTSILELYLYETKNVMHQENNIKAYYTARSGADALASYIISNPDKAGTTVSNPGNGTIEGNQFKVNVENIPGTSNLKITSTSTVRNSSLATVTLTLNYKNSSIFDNALFTDKGFDLNKTTINGSVGTNASEGDCHVDRGKINGDLNTDQNMTFPAIDDSKFIYHGSSLSAGTYNVSGEKLYYKVNKVNLKGTETIKVTGDGELHILVTDSISMVGNSSIESLYNGRIYIYYAGSNTINLNGGPEFNGMLYAPNAEVIWNGGGNESINGSIIAKDFSGANSENVSINYDSSFSNIDLPLVGAKIYKRMQWGN